MLSGAVEVIQWACTSSLFLYKLNFEKLQMQPNKKMFYDKTLVSDETSKKQDVNL